MFPLAEVQSFTIFVSVKSCFPLFFPLSSGICFPYGFVELLHSGGAVPFHFLGDVTIHIQRERGCGVSQINLHGLDVIACLQGCHRKAVAKIMKSGIRDSNSLSNRFEVLDYGSSDEVLSQGIGEYQIVGIVPGFPCLHAGKPLIAPFLLKRFHDDGRRCNGSALSAFGGTEEVFSVLALKLLLHMDDAIFEIHILPG